LSFGQLVGPPLAQVIIGVTLRVRPSCLMVKPPSVRISIGHGALRSKTFRHLVQLQLCRLGTMKSLSSLKQTLHHSSLITHRVTILKLFGQKVPKLDAESPTVQTHQDHLTHTPSMLCVTMPQQEITSETNCILLQNQLKHLPTTQIIQA